MKDPIKELVQQSKLETSVEFTEKTMDLLQQRIERKMKRKLYCLAAFIAAFFSTIIIALIYFGFKVDVLGTVIDIPKTGSIIVLSCSGYFMLLHLSILLRSELFRQPQIN